MLSQRRRPTCIVVETQPCKVPRRFPSRTVTLFAPDDSYLGTRKFMGLLTTQTPLDDAIGRGVSRTTKTLIETVHLNLLSSLSDLPSIRSRRGRSGIYWLVTFNRGVVNYLLNFRVINAGRFTIGQHGGWNLIALKWVSFFGQIRLCNLETYVFSRSGF